MTDPDEHLSPMDLDEMEAYSLGQDVPRLVTEVHRLREQVLRSEGQRQDAVADGERVAADLRRQIGDLLEVVEHTKDHLRRSITLLQRLRPGSLKMRRLKALQRVVDLWATPPKPGGKGKG